MPRGTPNTPERDAKQRSQEGWCKATIGHKPNSYAQCYHCGQKVWNRKDGTLQPHPEKV